jgi:hypothetical protein
MRSDGATSPDLEDMTRGVNLASVRKGTHRSNALSAPAARKARPEVAPHLPSCGRVAVLILSTLLLHFYLPAACRGARAGDCNDDGVVDIAELVRAVGIAAGSEDAGCPSADVNSDTRVDVSELTDATVILPKQEPGIESELAANLVYVPCPAGAFAPPAPEGCPTDKK